MRALRVVLIGGTSSVGKSSLAHVLATRLGWRCVSTDSLGRHPGRPWQVGDRQVPPHVARHYLARPAEDLTTDQLRHYERMWPVIESLVSAHACEHGPGRLSLEGSGVWPDRAVQVTGSRVAAIWLTASPGTLRERIYAASRYRELAGREQFLMDQFLRRTNLYNELMVSAVSRLGLALVDVDSLPSLDALAAQCFRLLS